MKRALLVAAVSLLLFSSTTLAIDIQNIQPAMGPQNLLSLYTSDPLAMGQFALGIVGNYTGGPLRFEYDVENSEEINVVDRLLAVQGYAVVGLFDIFDLMAGGSFNSVYGEDMDQFAVPGLAEADGTSGAAPGDATFAIKARILKNKPGSIGLALLANAAFPTGDPDLYVGADAITGGGSLILDKRFDLVNLVGNVGYRYLGSPEDLEPAAQIHGGLGIDVAITEWFGATGEFVGRNVDYGIDGIDATAPLETLVGVRFFTPVGLNFLLAGGFGLTDGIGSPLYRGIAGVSFVYPELEYGPQRQQQVVPPPPDPRVTDTDRDGLTDFIEQNETDTDMENPDTDGDGLLDGEEVNRFKTSPKKADTDGDGLTDASEVRVYGTDPLKVDTDGDTLTDGLEVNDLRTNPLSKDTDADNVPDNLDAAPLEPETVNGYMDEDGVPEIVLARKRSGVMMLENQIVLPTELAFAGPDSSKLSIPDKILLDDVALILTEYPQIKISIEGHVARGTINAAQLTQDRANSVMNYLAKKRVGRERMIASGLGDTVPIAPNDTEAGRKRNTRIDFIITSQ